MSKTIQFPFMIPLLPLYGAILLPNSRLPVPISSYDYQFIVEPALADYDMIGIVQPSLDTNPITLYKTGCLAKLEDLKETEDERWLAVFSGLCRFDIQEEIESEQEYRLAKVSYDRFSFDLEENDHSFDRKPLLTALEAYLGGLDVGLNWKEIKETSDHKLITAVAMICPLNPRERQALLETSSLQDQSSMITTLIKFAKYELPFARSSFH